MTSKILSRPIRSAISESQVPRGSHNEGRTQAAHRDPSVPQHDRARGYRRKGGKRTGRSHS